MSNYKILYACQEISPYLPEDDVSEHCNKLVQAMQEKGNEIRTFMPRYGVINERRHQLHEVIRLSGMNVIIDDNDHQLIIKVASIPSARVQVYFIDNEEYFSRRHVLTDDEGNYFDDNDERAIFFARGMLETVKKLMWDPEIVHCNGWLTAVVPIYLKYVFADDPLFKDAKIVVSIYEDGFPGKLNEKFGKKIEKEVGDVENMKVLAEPTYQNLMKLVIDHADGFVIETENPDAELIKRIEESGKPCLEYQDREDENYLDNYHEFYGKVL